MIKHIKNQDMGSSPLDWLENKLHFSFADYYDPDNLGYGPLRVLNDDIFLPNNGFSTHQHKNVEIISYIISGTLTHGDNMGNVSEISRGHIQYISAGKGIFHNEFNKTENKLRFLQIWIIPNTQDLEPHYKEMKYRWDLRKNTWLNIVSSLHGDALVKINQDINIYVVDLDKDKHISFKIKGNKTYYLVQMEGQANINNLIINEKDGVKIISEDINIQAVNDKAHIMLIEIQNS